MGEIPVGVLATDERGNYDGALVLPATVPLGDYEAKARTLGTPDAAGARRSEDGRAMSSAFI